MSKGLPVLDENSEAHKRLVKERIKEMKADMEPEDFAPIIPTYLYFLLEPDEDIIRYVGHCTHPASRYRQHVNSCHSPRLFRWIDSLRMKGTLPRMQLVAKIRPMKWSREAEVCGRWLAARAEQALIEAVAKGRYYGNQDMEADLLNRQHVPENFLPNGLDAGKDRS